jgi:methionine-rich copper-binding protein CopC
MLPRLLPAPCAGRRLRASARAALRYANALALGLIAAMPAPTAAFAHAFLLRTVPAAGSTVRTAPPRLVLRFTEAVVSHFCQVTLRGPAGAAILIRPPRAVPGHPRTLLVRLPPLPPGPYRVTWRAVARDTHRTAGSFRFTVSGTSR